MSRLIVITGVTRGLGRALTEGFAALGHTVAGCGRSAEAIERLGEQLGPPHAFEVVDVTSDIEVRAWAGRVFDRLGIPDLVVNNAAQINRNARLWEVPAEEFDRVIDANVKGVANVIRYFVPPLIERGSGVVVNFSSYWGRTTAPEVAPYCASKWAIEGLTRALAQELPRGVAAVALNPGVIDTDMLRSCFGASAGSYLDPRQWAESAVPFFLQLGAKDNGKAVTVPGQ